MSSAAKRRPTSTGGSGGSSGGSGRTVKPPAPAKPVSKGPASKGPASKGPATKAPTGKGPGGKGPAGSARARLAAQQAEADRRRRRMIIVIVPLAVILVAVATLIVVRFAANGSNTATTGGSGVIPKVTAVPPATLNQVGTGSTITPPKKIDGPALTENGKPKVLYVGAEYCPYCAGERWAMVVALSRFGSFSNLGQTTSSGSDIYPNTATLSFHGASFSSDVVAFTGVETEDRSQQALDTLSAEDQKTFDTYDYPPYVAEGSKGSIPFVDIGGKYLISGASYDVQVLQGKTHQQIADALSDPNSAIAKAVDGTANMITAAICASTDGKPANVCSSAGVQAGAKAIG